MGCMQSPPVMSSTASHPHCAAIIVAAGSSRRMGMGMDKLAWPLAGVPVLRRTLEAFLAAPSIQSVIVVCPEVRWNLLDGVESVKPLLRMEGGAERQHSVCNGLAALGNDVRFVAVHDGARPLVSTADIESCVAAALVHQAASLARRASETMKRSDADDFCVDSVCRDHLWCMETPQVFDVSLLREAVQVVSKSSRKVTDEVSAVQAIGAKVKFIESMHPNLKITTPADLALAEALLAQAS
jgi:2-C-methyl-D-erythritol 4-phosphate cytidylyltransferase